jgi:hypothetical protein
MQLVRLGELESRQDANRYSTDRNAQRVKAYFDKFGIGDVNFNDFVIELEWTDVGTIIREFAQMGNKEAARFQRAMELMGAMEDGVRSWKETPQSN